MPRSGDVAEKRHIWHRCQPEIDADRLVFLDETGLSTDLMRRRGWSEGGSRLVDAAPCGRWHTNTLVAAIGTVGGQAAMLLDGPMNGVCFAVFCRDLPGPAGFCRDLLAPSLEPGQIVVLDNLGSHYVAAAAEAIESVSCSLCFLPPYSSDLNPIEMVFSKLKGLVRRLRPRGWDAIVEAARTALLAITPDDCRNCIQHCGYQSL